MLSLFQILAILSNVQQFHCFNLHFSSDIQCEVSFHVLVCHLYIFGEVSIKAFDPFFNLVVFLSLNFKHYWHILDNSPLSGMYFVNTFFKSMACFLNLLTLSFTKFLILMKFRWPEISFMDHNFGVIVKQLYPYPRCHLGLLLCCLLGVL